MNKLKVPQLRFPGFDGEWEKKKLGEIAKIITGNTPSTAIAEYYNGEKLFVSPADIQENRYVYTTKTTLTENGFKKGRKIKKGSVLFVCIGSTIGKVGQASVECLTNQQINALEANKEYKNDFIYNLLEKNGAKIKMLAGVQAVPQINKTDFSNFKYLIPTLPEQQKIASFLSAVDEKIQQLSRKKELLEQYKKGVMQQLFSGKLRFKDENGKDYPDWEEKKLGDVGKFYAGGDLDKLNYSKTKSEEFTYPIYANGSGEGIYGYATTFQYKKNSVTVSGRGNLGYANIRTQNFNAIVRLIVIEPKDFINPKYLEETINQTKFAIESTGVPQLTVPQIKSYKILIPSLSEQQKIANFLSSIDAKIENTNSELEKTQGFKKGLLQKMFV